MSITRICRTCGLEKAAEFFTPFAKGKNGLYPHCKECRKPQAKKQYQNSSIEQRLYNAAKGRAKRKGREFTISLEDIKIPKYCPVFHTLMDRPSLDRKDNSLGYTPENTRVICYRANMLKNNATVEELLLILTDIGGGVKDD